MKEGGLGIGTILFLIFMILKLCGVISWSWWWITAPLWIPIAIIIIVVICMFIITIIRKMINKSKTK